MHHIRKKQLLTATRQVLAALADIQDPFRGDSLVKLGAVKELVVDSGCGKAAGRHGVEGWAPIVWNFWFVAGSDLARRRQK